MKRPRRLWPPRRPTPLSKSRCVACVIAAGILATSARMQIDDPARGFSFKEPGPLDMRMNPTRGRPASALLSELGESALAEILAKNSDQPQARELASAIHRAHAREPLMTTQARVAVVCDASARWPGVSDRTADDPVRRVFQALRIAVNDEFGALTEFLRTLPTCLKP